MKGQEELEKASGEVIQRFLAEIPLKDRLAGASTDEILAALSTEAREELAKKAALPLTRRALTPPLPSPQSAPGKPAPPDRAAPAPTLQSW